jgi:transcriptional regulator with XRE-family HTH domain
MINRAELATFLRKRRERLQPRDAGLPGGQRRRTPGLRRQEVAELAGLSVDYYIRLEQGRGPRPSRQVLAALARALMLTADEREYLFRIAGEEPSAVAGPRRDVPAGIRYLLDALTEVPAYVVSAKYDILAWNRLATYFIGDLAGAGPDERNMVRWMFALAPDDGYWDDEQAVAFTRSVVADLRAAYARYPGDRSIDGLVGELLALSPRFAGLWGEHEVAARHPMVKRVDHPLAGPVEFECQVMHIQDTDQRLIAYVAAPGSPTAAAFARLAAAAAPARLCGGAAGKPLAAPHFRQLYSRPAYKALPSVVSRIDRNHRLVASNLNFGMFHFPHCLAG